MSATRGLVADTIPFSGVDGPGNRFVVFLQGCNFDCVACHNPQTIPRVSDRCASIGTDELLDEIRRVAPFLSGVTVSGGEATVQWRFVHGLFAAIKSDPELSRLTCFIDSNGAAARHVWDVLAPVTDGVMVDLKCLDPVIHLALTTRRNELVLDSIRYLARIGLLAEVRLLLVAGVNDDPALLRATATWLAGIDPHLRIQLIAFRSHGVRAGADAFATPTPAAMRAARDLMTEAADFQVTTV